MHWYVIHTKPRQEFRAQENLSAQGFEVFLPKIGVQKLKNKNLEIVHEPLFPRYLFICLDQVKSNWFPIKSTLGVHQIVRFGMGSDPAKVDPELIHMLKKHEREISRPRSLFEAGELIQIKDGPLKGLEGFYQRLVQEESGQARALILLEMLGKQQNLRMPVEMIETVR